MTTVTQAIETVSEALTDMAMRHDQIKGNNAAIAFDEVIVPALRALKESPVQGEALDALQNFCRFSWSFYRDESQNGQTKIPRDAAFYAAELKKHAASLSPAAKDQPAPQVDVQKEFDCWLESRSLSTKKVDPNEWGHATYANSHIEAMYEGWLASRGLLKGGV